MSKEAKEKTNSARSRELNEILAILSASGITDDELFDAIEVEMNQVVVSESRVYSQLRHLLIANLAILPGAFQLLHDQTEPLLYLLAISSFLDVVMMLLILGKTFLKKDQNLNKARSGVRKTLIDLTESGKITTDQGALLLQLLDGKSLDLQQDGELNNLIFRLDDDTSEMSEEETDQEGLPSEITTNNRLNS